MREEEKPKIEIDKIVIKEQKLKKEYDYRYENKGMKILKSLGFYLQYVFQILIKNILIVIAKILKILCLINTVFIFYFFWKVLFVGGERLVENLEILMKVVITEVVLFLILKILKLGTGILWGKEKLK